MEAALLAGKLASRLLGVVRGARFGLVFLERELLPGFSPLFEELAFAFNKRLHFDFDDAIHLHYAKDANPIAKILGLARSASAGNEWLADWARPFRSNVQVVPTAVDTKRFAPNPQEGDIPFVWSGTSSNLRYLEAIAPALRRVPGARLLVVCDRAPPALGVQVEYRPWSRHSEVALLRRGKIGLMPLPDEEWARGKCGLKLLTYLAVGIPVVASPVGVNGPMVQQGSCGVLATTEDQWVEGLNRLLADADLRRRMGDLGRRYVESRYSVDAVYPLLRSALDDAFEASLA